MFNNISDYEFNNISRIVIIGDIHGDLKRFKSILINEKIINNNFEWIAEPSNTIIVQLGDQIDSINRDNNIEEWEKIKDIEMIYFTDNLDLIAKSKGGMVISLIGNHEMMNTLGDFSYVSNNSKIDIRREIFKPSGSIALILSKRPLIVKINNLIFCHALLTLEHYKILLKNNKNINYINELWRKYLLKIPIYVEDKEIFDNIILSDKGILWNREENNINNTETLFKLLNCKYMFIGHTPINSIKLIDNQIWYCDNAISRSFGSLEFEYININNYNIEIKKINDYCCK